MEKFFRRSGDAITLDTYSHVAPGLQEAATNRFDDVLLPGQIKCYNTSEFSRRLR